VTRVITFTLLGVIAAVASYLLLFTGGHARGGSFAAGNLRVEYEISAPGAVRPERIDYVVLSDGRYDEKTIHATAGGDTSFTLVYRGAGSDTKVPFKTKPGETVWIGKDRKARFAPKPLQMGDVHLLEKHAGRESLQAIGSLEELQAAIAKRKGEP